MLTIENILNNYDELMQKNGYSEAQRLENIQTIRNALLYENKESLSADSLPYESAKLIYPDIQKWNGIPVNFFLNLLEDSNISPIKVVTEKDNKKYLICKLNKYGECSSRYVKFDISDDCYEANDEDQDSANKMTSTVLKWHILHCINVRDAVNAIEYKYLKDEFDTLREFVNDDFYKSIETNYAEALKLFME